MRSSLKRVKHQGRKRLTIGLMIDNVDDDYQRTIWAGVEQAAEEADVNLACFLGGDLNPADESTYLHNNIFKLISSESLDGLIVVSTCLATYIGNEQLREYCRRFESLPMVSLGFRLEGISSILVENQLGIKSIMDHLIEDHGYTKFLFIGGPLTNSDTAERQRLFIESLETHGINVNPELITCANFRPQEAYRVVEKTLDKKLEFEVVVSANDEMAIGAMAALRDRNILVPDQVAITGFDDIMSARYLVLPLTTVRQPTLEMSKRAMEILLEKIKKKKTNDLEFFKTRVIIRRSCGCLSHEAVKAGIPELKPKKGRLEADFQKLKTAVFEEMKTSNALEYNKDETDLFATVLEAFNDEIQSCFQKKVFLPVLDKTLRQSSLKGIDDTVWENFISALRKSALPYFADKFQDLIKVGNLLHQARVMIKDITKQIQSDLRLQLSGKTQTLQYVIDALIGSFDVPTLLDNLARELPRIGIKSCYLSVHTGKEKMYEEACLLLAYNGNGRIELNKEGCIYPAKQLFPQGTVKLKERHNIIFQPLIFREEEMGFIAMELNPLEEISSLALSEQIRSSLKASMMMQEIMEKDKKLSDLDRLKNDFIANITHDFRSHITVVLNSAKLGLEFDKKEDISEIIKRYNVIYDASIKLKTTIDRLLDLAKMDARGIKLNIQKLDIISYLADIVSFYRSATAASRITINRRFPAAVTDDFYTDVDKLEEIMHNLISNALKFVDPETGVITISLSDKQSSIEIMVSDNGIGIPRDKLEIIFGRFEQLENGRSSMHQGTGIGLAFAKELTGYLRGSIRAESDGPGKGARFILELKKGRDVYYDLKISEEAEYQPPVFYKRSQLKKIIKSNISDTMQKDEIVTFFTERNRENEFDPPKGVILIVDDDHAIREIVKEYLVKNGYKNFILVTNGKDAIDAIYQYTPDLIISDYNMPKLRGDEMQDLIASNPYLRQTPFLFLTVMTDKRIIQERKEKGALTFLTKPIDEREFLVSVDSNMRKHMEYLQLANQAPVDKLTGLANKATILSFLDDRLMLRAYRHLSLILIDIDNFKSINDAYGYQSGDALLSNLGKIIKNSLRSCDKGGRYKDENFLIVLPETAITEAHLAAEKLRILIEGMQIPVDDKKLTITASFGISSLIDNGNHICQMLKINNLKDLFEPENIQEADWEDIEKLKQKIKDLLLEMVNQALVKAKKSGRNKSVLFKEKK